MADGGSIVVKITGDDSQLQSVLSGIGKKASGAMDTFKGIMASQLVTKGFDLLAAGIRQSIETGMRFEAQMSQVAAISGATGAELQQLTDVARHYGETTMFTATQAGEALNYMALAGWNVDQMTAALPGVLNLAAASGMDLGRASDAVTDYLSAFGMEAGKATYMADLMAYAQANANTSAMQLSEAYNNCASSMHAAGQDIETTTAMLMGLANNGIKGSQAGTQMAAVMRDLTQKMDDGKIKIGEASVAVMDAQGNFRDLNDIIADVGKATEGLGTAEASAAIMDTFTARSVKAIQTLLNEGIDNVNAYEEALRGSEGTAAKQAEIMMDNLQGDVQIFKSALEGVQLTAYDAMKDSARAVVQQGTDVLTVMNQAGKQGGVRGMIQAFIGEIPGLTGDLMGALSDMFTGDMIPTVIDGLTGALGAGIEGVISNLPTLVPALAVGFGKVFEGTLTGVGNLAGGIYDGVAGALKKVGLMDYDLSDRISMSFDGVDTSGIEVGDIQLPDISLDGEVDVEAYTAKIQSAKESIQELVASFNIDEANAQSLEDALMKGSGAEALQSALKALNIDDSQIDDVTEKIGGFRDKLKSVFEEFKIEDSDGAIKAKIGEAVAAGESLQSALQTFAGLSADDALKAANELQPKLNEAVSAIQSLNLPNIDTSQIQQAVIQADGDIGLALSALGADNGQIAAALDQIKALKDSISEQLRGVFDELKTAFTDGIAENDAGAAEVGMEAINGLAEQGKQKIGDWLDSYVKQLGDMNLDAKQYADKMNEAQKIAQQMQTDLDTAIAGIQGWISENAGAATETVKANLAELDDFLANIEEVEARIDQLNSKLDTKGFATRAAVQAGQMRTQNAQVTAMGVTATEYEKSAQEAHEKILSARKEYEDAVLEAKKDHSRTGDEDAFSKAMKSADKKLTAAESEYESSIAKAGETYNRNMQAVAQGMIKSDGELVRALDGVKADKALRDTAQKLTTDTDALSQAFEAGKADGTSSYSERADRFLQSLGLDDASIQAIETQAGQNAGALKDAVVNALKGGDVGDDPFSILDSTLSNFDIGGESLKDFANGAEDAIASALNSMDLSNMAAVFQKAMEEGFLQNVEGYDWSDPQAAMRQALLDYVNGVEPEPVETTVPIEAEPEVTVADGAGEAVTEAVEEATDGADETTEVNPTIEVNPEVEASEETGEAIAEAVEEAAAGAEETAEANPTIQVNPEVEVSEESAGNVTEAIESATQGAEDTEAQTIEATANVNLTIGEVNVSEETNIGDMLTAQFEEQTMELSVSANVKIASATVDASGVTSAASTAVSAAVSAASGTASSGGSAVGSALASGIAAGISSGMGAVIAAAVAVVQAAVSAAKAAAGIASPSKVMAELGKFYDLGLAQGITENTKTVVDSALDMSRRTLGAVNLSPAVDFSGISGAMSSAVGDIADIESMRDVVLSVDGRELARTTAPDYNAALNGYAKYINLGYGRG